MSNVSSVSNHQVVAQKLFYHSKKKLGKKLNWYCVIFLNKQPKITCFKIINSQEDAQMQTFAGLVFIPFFAVLCISSSLSYPLSRKVVKKSVIYSFGSYIGAYIVGWNNLDFKKYIYLHCVCHRFLIMIFIFVQALCNRYDISYEVERSIKK